MSILKWYVKEKDGSPGLGSIGHAKWVLALVSVHFWQHSSVLNYPQKYCSEVVVGWKACVLIVIIIIIVFVPAFAFTTASRWFRSG